MVQKTKECEYYKRHLHSNIETTTRKYIYTRINRTWQDQRVDLLYHYGNEVNAHT